MTSNTTNPATSAVTMASLVAIALAVTLVTAVLALAVPAPASALPGDEVWRASYDGGVAGGQDQAHGLVFAPKGFLYVVGYAEHGAPAGVDATVLRYSASGSRKWKRFYDGPAHSSDRAQGAVADRAGNLYICGSVGRADLSTDLLLVKYTPAGRRVWVRTYDGPLHGNDSARAVALDGAGNVFVAGTVGDPADPMGADLRLLKYDRSGHRQWVRGFNPGAGHYLGISDLLIDKERGRVYVSAEYETTSNGWQWFLARYATNGTRKWRHDWGGADSDQAKALALSANGNIYQVGSTVQPPAVDSDAAIVKWTAAGEIADGWPLTFAGPGDGEDHYYDVTVDRSGKIHVVGDSFSGLSGANSLMCAYDSVGVVQYSSTYFHPGAQTLWKVACDRAGNTYAGGYSNEGGANPAYLVMKKANDGVSISWRKTAKESTTVTSGTDTLHSLAWRGGAYAGVYVTGNGDGDATEWDFFTIRFEP